MQFQLGIHGGFVTLGRMLFLALGISIWAIHASNGVFHGHSLPLYAYTALFLLLCTYVWRFDSKSKGRFGEWSLWTLGLLSLWMFRHQHYMLYFTDSPFQSLQEGLKWLWALCWLAQMPHRKNPVLLRTSASWLGMLGATVFLVLVILAHPVPPTDVFTFQQEGIEALLAGQNPYERQYTNIYEATSQFYPPGGPSAYPYPPWSLLLSLPLAWTGDVRWELLLNHLLASACIGWIARSRMLAALMLFQAHVPHMIRHAWTEPRIALWIGIVLLFMRKSPRLAAWSVGGVLALKQYLVLWMLPLLWWTRGLKQRSVLWIKALGIPVFAYGIFWIWNPAALWDDMVVFHLTTPFRPDGLTWNAWLHARGLPILSSVWSVIAVALVACLGFLRATSKPQQMATLVALLLGFFLLSKHAFVNYFYLIQMGLGFAAALRISGQMPSKDGSSASSQ